MKNQNKEQKKRASSSDSSDSSDSDTKVEVHNKKTINGRKYSADSLGSKKKLPQNKY